MTEFKLFDEPGADIASITTDGSTIKPFLNAIDAVAGEAKLHIDEGGISTSLVDASNVFAGIFELGAGAFEEYEYYADATVGVSIDQIRDLTRRARKGRSDELSLSIRENELTATVSRGYENHNVVSQGTMRLLDPDSIRGEPDLHELDPDVSVSAGAQAVRDALSFGVGASDYVKLSAKGVNQHADALYVGGETDTTDESIALDNVTPEKHVESIYSSDYVRDLAGGIGAVSPESVTLWFDDEYPMRVEAENEELGLSVEYVISPRIQA